jgi:hypothetical protein
MSMSHHVYIFCLIVITVGVLIYYYTQQMKHLKELEKIAALEIKQAKADQALEVLRSQTTPCPSATIYKDPRTCYTESNYTCSWNDATQRCETNPS